MTAAVNPDRERCTNEAFSLMEDLVPICRSISGNGLRQTLRRIQQEIPLSIEEVPTGTSVLDWTVPEEWNIEDAYVASATGGRLIDFRECSLHLVNYSVPVRATLTRQELESHLHSLPGRREAIPYKTAYYSRDWGFCLSQKQREELGEGPFEVLIDSSLKPGSVSLGECRLEGTTEDEVLFSTHCCHPYMANDNLSGIAIATGLAKALSRMKRRMTYRFLFLPGTIGAISWLARNDVSKVKAGLVLSCLGDQGGFTYKRTFHGAAHTDRVVEGVLRRSGTKYAIQDFHPYGYDERQFNSPGFRLPVGCFMRTPHGRFPEYHTSADNLEFLSRNSIYESYRILCDVIDAIEADVFYENLSPYGEPQLGRRGLYGVSELERDAMLWMLSASDGTRSLLGIAEKSELEVRCLREAAEKLVAAGLLRARSGQ